MIFGRFLERAKNRMVFEYSDMGDPYLKVTLCAKSGAGKERVFPLGAHRIERGCIANAEGLAKDIEREFGKAENFSLVLKLSETFKSVVSVPKMSVQKAVLLAKKELKAGFPKYREKYVTVDYRYKYSLGYAFYTYFIPNDIIYVFKTLASRLQVRLTGIDIFGGALLKKLYPLVKRDFACIYTENGIATIINSCEGKLITAFDFPFTCKEDIVKQFVLVAGKHEFELERKPIKNLVVLSDRSLRFDDCFRGINCIRVNRTDSAFALAAASAAPSVPSPDKERSEA